MESIESLRLLAAQLEQRAKTVQQDLDSATQAVREEKECWEEEKKLLSSRYSINDNIIELNVGGIHFTTYKSVLCKQPGSMLEAMFSGRHPIAKDTKGRYFIDSDGRAFEYVLNFLRFNQMVWPDENSMKRRVRLVLDYFAVKYLPENFKESVILKGRENLLELLLSLFDSIIETKLIYRASTDGWTGQNFHKKCDNIKNTLTLIQVGDHVFGGYTPCLWNAVSNDYTYDEKSFLFSLSNPTGTHTGVKFSNTGPSGKYSIYCNNGYGPTFGGGHDIYIASNAKQNTNSYVNIGHGYAHPVHAYGTYEAKNFFCGSHTFTPKEVEVFVIE